MSKKVPSSSTLRLTPHEYEEIKAFIEELQLIPSQFITPSVAKIWRAEVMQEREERVLDLIRRDEMQDLLDRFYRSNHSRKSVVDQVNIQLEFHFD